MASTTSTATVADAALSATGVAVSDIEGTDSGTVTVAGLHRRQPEATTADSAATIISWGEVFISTGTGSPGDRGTFSVSGSHNAG